MLGGENGHGSVLAILITSLCCTAHRARLVAGFPHLRHVDGRLKLREAQAEPGPEQPGNRPRPNSVALSTVSHFRKPGPPTLLDMMIVFLTFVLGEIILSRLLYRRIRDRPY